MNAKPMTYPRAAAQTFIVLVFIYTFLAIVYALGLLPVPSDDTRMFYFFRFWLSLPVALMVTACVWPLVCLGKYMETKFHLPRIYPYVAILPMSFIIHAIAVVVPIILIPIFLVGAFIYPLAAQNGNWGLVETTISSINISVAFAIFWASLEKR